MLVERVCFLIRKIECFIRNHCAKTHSLVNTILEPVTEHNKYRLLEDIITPLATVPYEKQLHIKNTLIREHVLSLIKNSSLKSYRILPITPSPVIDHYRGKDEFNVQMGIDGNPKTFGFYTGGFSDKPVYAVSPIHLRNVKSEHKRVVQVFEEFVRKSPLPPCYRLNDGGYWRQILVRSNLKGEIMAVVVVHPQNRSSEEFKEEREQLCQHFISHDVQLHSLYHHLSTHVKGTDKNSQLTLIHGEPFLYEDFLQHKFRISPSSFFQINVKAAETLHEKLLQLANFKSTDTLLDLCCGVGTFSISYSNHIRNSIGIEQSLNSVDDALSNCSVNNVSNCFFTVGKLEERLNSIYDLLDNVRDLVVILNPGRSGVHPRVIEILRNHSLIRKLFYVSCKPDNRFTINNVRSLLEKENQKTDAFILKTILPVDLFPHTVHYEMIMHFER